MVLWLPYVLSGMCAPPLPTVNFQKVLGAKRSTQLLLCVCFSLCRFDIYWLQHIPLWTYENRITLKKNNSYLHFFFLLCNRVLCSPAWSWALYVTEDNLELLNLPSPFLHCWDYRHVLLHLVYGLLGIELKTLCMIGEHHASLATCPALQCIAYTQNTVYQSRQHWDGL